MAAAAGTIPLLDLLMDLRAATVPVDIPKCLLLLRTIEGGFGSDREALRRVLHHLFSSSPDERRIVDACYERFLARLGSHTEKSVESDLPQEAIGANERDGANETESALRLLRSESLEIAPGASPALIQRLVDAASGPDESELIEASGVAISPRDYLPISRRQMRQTWRYLRVPVREGPAVEISIRETLAQAARRGPLVEPVLVPRRVSRSELMLLVDVHGSMTPFHEVARRMVHTAEEGGRFRSVRTFYFHNVPDENLMTTPAFIDAVPLRDFLTRTSPRWCSIVIVSDAGAARGSNNLRRSEAARRFVERLYRARFRIAWLNPVPQNRWEGTSAATIARCVPMYEISRRGVDSAIAQLKEAVQQRAPVIQ